MSLDGKKEEEERGSLPDMRQLSLIVQFRFQDSVPGQVPLKYSFYLEILITLSSLSSDHENTSHFIWQHEGKAHSSIKMWWLQNYSLWVKEDYGVWMPLIFNLRKNVDCKSMNLFGLYFGIHDILSFWKYYNNNNNNNNMNH